MILFLDKKDQSVLYSKFDGAIDKDAKCEGAIKDGEEARSCLDKYNDTLDPADLKLIDGQSLTRFIVRPLMFKAQRDATQLISKLYAAETDEQLEGARKALKIAVESDPKRAALLVREVDRLETRLRQETEVNTSVSLDLHSLLFRAALLRVDASPLPAALVEILDHGRVDGYLPENVLDYFEPMVVMDIGSKCSALFIQGKKKTPV